jgi:adenosylcobinamide-phosphate synthase
MGFYFQFLLSIVLDGLFGDPRWYPHPVRLIGGLCTICEKLLRPLPIREIFAGMITVVTVIFFTLATLYVLLMLSLSVNPLCEAVVAVFLLYTTLAARDLMVHSLTVQRALENDDLRLARMEVAKIVGRDTKGLDEENVARACVETVAENMVDGITAPLFFALFASLLSFFSPLSAISWAALGAFFYKAVNTMDSMIGYKNSNYIEFGRTAARLDDIVNFLPARISGCCLIAAAFFVKVEYKNAAKIFIRDRLNHASPNAAHPESAVAGALGIRLGGPSSYFGQLIDKTYIGNPLRPIRPQDIQRTNTLVIVASIIFVVIMMAVHIVVSPG